LTWNVVTDAPCQEIVLQGAALDRPGAALDGIPVPISIPGWANARSRQRAPSRPATAGHSA
jgi:hypothetical protein